MADVPIDCDFPIWGLLPKKETGVHSFQTKNPEYDGRGTIIAIFDSGVDPAAEGLKVTSTGETKVIERFDCSGSGDVDTSTVRKAVDGCITGITGRKLKIPDTWNNPTGNWRVGVLYPFSLYPVKLKERVQEHRKEHLWDVGHKSALAEATKQLNDFDNEIGKNASPTPDEKQQREELESRVDILQSTEKKYNDVGPTYDCVLFHDGTVWRACIDTSEKGELAAGVTLAEYGATHQHSHLTPLDEMTVSVNVHDGGDTLEVVGMCSTHGTHVAAIAAAHFAEEPARSGVAPGARLVSLTIGDSRLGSMETGAALVRACIRVMQLCAAGTAVHVVNMSYGEHAHWSNAGRVGEVMNAVVSRYGVSWVVSGGNHGPALATVGAPPDIAHPVLIGVGAYVSPEMMSAAYSMRARGPPGAFSWSSRGPCPDGGAGLSVCAPGGAVASVARFTLRQSQLMNGTSMAAPHVAGAVAALISGLKAKELPYSPYSMKRALENSATYLSHVEPWAQGCGLLNIEKAFELLSTYSDAGERDVTFSVTCSGGHGKGVLLRPTAPSAPSAPPAPFDVTVTVEPVFLRDHRDENNLGVIPKQIEWGMRLALACEGGAGGSGGAAWLSAPRHLDLMNIARPFGIRIDTRGLPPGPHFTSINAYDVSCVEKGPVFRVPVTVLQPAALSAAHALAGGPALFRPAAIQRHFVIPPADATWCVVRLQASDGAGGGGAGGSGGGGGGLERGGRFLLHSMQLLPRRSCRSHEAQKMLTVTADAPATLPFRVVGGVTLEVAIAKYWANVGDMLLDYSIEFHGIKPDFGQRLLVTGHALAPVLLTALRPQDVQPAAHLKHAEPVYRPAESKLSPLGARDVLPPGRQIYQLINTYNFNIAKATEVSPVVSMLCDMLYESELESQLWMLYSAARQLLAAGDAYPAKYSVKLDKGDYTLRLCIRHDNRALLERLHDLPLVVQHRLPQPIALDAYCHPSHALTGGKKFTSTSLPAGNLLPLYFTPPPADKITKFGSTVAALTGTLTFARDECGRKVDTYALHVTPAEPPRRPPAPHRDRDKDKARPHDDFLDAYKDFVANWLPKLEGEKLDLVYEEALEKFPNLAALHTAYLHALDPPTDPKKLPHANEECDVTIAWCEQIISIADKVIKQIDQDKLLAYLGMKTDTRPDATKIKQEQERTRAQLLEALARRGTALCRLRALPAPPPHSLLDALHANLADVLRLADLSDPKVIHYGVWHCFTLQQWGRAVKLLQKIQEDKPSREVEERLAEAYRQLGWAHLAAHTLAALPLKYPPAYRPF